MENVEIIDHLIQNEKKSKQFTTVLVLLLALACIAAVWFGYKNVKLNQSLRTKQTEIEAKKQELAAKNAELDMITTNCDVEKNILQMKLREKGEVYQVNTNANVIEEPLLEATPKSISSSNEEIPSAAAPAPTPAPAPTVNRRPVIAMAVPPPAQNQKPVIYIQYMDRPVFQKQCLWLLHELQMLGYKNQPAEKISEFTFPYAIKYNNENDINYVQQIADIMRKKMPDENIKLIPLKNNSNKRVIEIWLGQYQRKSINQLKKEYSVSENSILKQAD